MNPSELLALLPERSPDRLALAPLRSNAREADRLVHARLLGDLKGVSLPVHVMVDDASSMHASDLVFPHKYPKGLPYGSEEDLGNGLSVLLPEYAVSVPCCRMTAVQIAKMMFEACGIFSLLPLTGRLGLAIKDMLDQGMLVRDSSRPNGVYGYSDEYGRPILPCGLDDGSVMWSPSFDTSGRLTNLWKRPPITSVERLELAIDKLDGTISLEEVRRALKVVFNGAASPEEVYAVMLLCSGAWFGGESFGSPDLNRRISFTPRGVEAYEHIVRGRRYPVVRPKGRFRDSREGVPRRRERFRDCDGTHSSSRVHGLRCEGDHASSNGRPRAVRRNTALALACSGLPTSKPQRSFPEAQELPPSSAVQRTLRSKMSRD